jgi:hypothetical protein
MDVRFLTGSLWMTVAVGAFFAMVGIKWATGFYGLFGICQPNS